MFHVRRRPRRQWPYACLAAGVTTGLFVLLMAGLSRVPAPDPFQAPTPNGSREVVEIATPTVLPPAAAAPPEAPPASEPAPVRLVDSEPVIHWIHDHVEPPRFYGQGPDE